ncbi:MAG: hypothetical protein HC859_07240 [Bacteroidia bacterium]|nr:hypothetical protein [Bacteroidia bacterium]
MSNNPSTVNSQDLYLAVLPFQEISGGDLYSAGLVMDIITDLSRFRSFQIISYDSIKDVPAGQWTGDLVQSLNVDYLVKGLLRYHEHMLIINVELVNARHQRVVWAEKFTGRLDDLFQIEGDIVERIVGSLQHFVEHDVLSQVRRKPITSLNAYECWVRGTQELLKGTLAADEAARSYFLKAMELDPHYARAYTGMSLTHFNEWSCQIWDRWEVSQRGAFEWAQRALELDATDHVSSAILGKLHLYSGDYDKAEVLMRRAIALCPHDAGNLLQAASALVFLGFAAEALELYNKAKRLNPAGDDSMYTWGTMINFENGHMEAAIKEAQQVRGKGWVDFPAYVAAAHFYTGDYEKMRSRWTEFLEQFSLKINDGKPADNHAALQWMMNVNPFKGPTRLVQFWNRIGEGTAALQAAEKPSAGPLYPNSFLSDGKLWSLAYQGRQVQMADRKGLHDIAALLARPDQPIHCTELANTRVLDEGIELIDVKAKRSYQRRILELREQLQEAAVYQHGQETAALQEEYENLIDHLSKATGIGGRTRVAAAGIEKVRTAVTWRIRDAIKKISELHPPLGRHLEASVKTGIVCRYSPEVPAEWIL